MPYLWIIIDFEISEQNNFPLSLFCKRLFSDVLPLRIGKKDCGKSVIPTVLLTPQAFNITMPFYFFPEIIIVMAHISSLDISIQGKYFLSGYKVSSFVGILRGHPI